MLALAPSDVHSYVTHACRKPHLQGRFSGRLATKEDEKRLVDECKLLGPLLGGVGKRGDGSRLTLAKIVRGIAAGEVRRYCEERERTMKVRFGAGRCPGMHGLACPVKGPQQLSVVCRVMRVAWGFFKLYRWCFACQWQGCNQATLCRAQEWQNAL